MKTKKRVTSFILALVVLDKDNLKILKKISILQIFGLLK